MNAADKVYCKYDQATEFVGPVAKEACRVRVQNYKEFQDGSSRALNQAQNPSKQRPYVNT